MKRQLFLFDSSEVGGRHGVWGVQTIGYTNIGLMGLGDLL